MYTPRFVNRQWQEAALAAWVGHGRRGIVEVATGAGKTNLGLLCAAEALDRAVAERVFILVPTIALLDQWYVSLQEDLGVEESDLRLWGGGHTPSGTGPFNLMVLNTARDLIDGFTDLDRSMLIVDECHRAGSLANSQAIRGSFAATLGMSATPEGQYDDRLEQVLAPSLGPVIYRYGLAEAYRDGILSRFELVNIGIPLGPEEQEKYADLTRRALRILHSKKVPHGEKEEKLKETLRRRAAVSNRARLRVPVAVRIVEQHRGERCLVFHEYIGEAEKIARDLQNRGHSVALYHSHISDGMRHDNLRLFRRGRFDVLVTCRALDEGVNIPEVRVAVIAASTATQRQRIQRLGRVLRPAPGKDLATVYTIYATQTEEARLTKEAFRLAGDAQIEWRKVTPR